MRKKKKTKQTTTKTHKTTKQAIGYGGIYYITGLEDINLKQQWLLAFISENKIAQIKTKNMA